jgi:hypothetical protein
MVEMEVDKALAQVEAQIIDACPHCPDTLYTFDTGDREDLYASSYEYFHQPCPAHRCSQPDVIQDALCEQCRHLRLCHLLNCMQWKPGHDGVDVNLDTRFRKERFMAKTCPFCRLIQKLLLSGTYNPAVLETGDPLIMGPSEDEPYLAMSLGFISKQSAGITATIFVTDTTSISRTPSIGALHIDNRGVLQSVGPGHCSASTVDQKGLVSEMIDWRRIREVVQTYHNDHPGCRNAIACGLPQGFRVINVAKRCIVEKAV